MPTVTPQNVGNVSNVPALSSRDVEELTRLSELTAQANRAASAPRSGDERTGALTPPRSPVRDPEVVRRSDGTVKNLPHELAAATAAILDLNSRAARAEGLTAASRVVVEQFAAHLQLDRVALAWRSSSGRCVLRTISGLPTFDQRSETVGLLQAVADEAAARQSDGSWPPLSSVNRHALLAHRRLVEASRVDAAATFVLQDHGRVRGVLIISGSRAAAHDPAHIRFLRTAADCLVSTLSLNARAEGG